MTERSNHYRQRICFSVFLSQHFLDPLNIYCQMMGLEFEVYTSYLVLTHIHTQQTQMSVRTHTHTHYFTHRHAHTHRYTRRHTQRHIHTRAILHTQTYTIPPTLTRNNVRKRLARSFLCSKVSPPPTRAACPQQS